MTTLKLTCGLLKRSWKARVHKTFKQQRKEKPFPLILVHWWSPSGETSGRLSFSYLVFKICVCPFPFSVAVNVEEQIPLLHKTQTKLKECWLTSPAIRFVHKLTQNLAKESHKLQNHTTKLTFAAKWWCIPSTVTTAGQSRGATLPLVTVFTTHANSGCVVVLSHFLVVHFGLPERWFTAVNIWRSQRNHVKIWTKKKQIDKLMAF